MTIRIPLSVLLIGMSSSLLFAQDWKPAPGPLMTRWGKAIDPAKVLPEYPRPQMVRSDWQNLNGLWEYAITTKESEKPERFEGKILVPFCAESSLSGVGKMVGEHKALWYRRTFDSGDLKGGKLLLHFEAVDWQTKAWVNGQLVGEHEGGFDPFTFDITKALKASGSNEIVLRVWDPTDAGSQPVGKQIRNPHGIWYTPVTGIWQTAWLERVPESYIRSVRLTPDLDQGEIEVLVNVEGDAASVSLESKADKKLLGTGTPNKPFRIKVPTDKPWTPDEPNLTEVTVSLNKAAGGPVADKVDSYYAMRKISFGKDEKGINRLLLNNKVLFQIGPLDQGWWPDGLLTPPSEEAMLYDLKVLKEMGLNMLRKHIKVEPSRYYYACDKMGLLVWQDMPSVINRNKKHFVAPNAPQDADFTDEEHALYMKELKAMMDHLSFFPSIVIWVPFNEGWGQHRTNEVLKWTKEYDKSRLVNGPSGWVDRGFGHMKDMHNYPGPGMFPVMPDRVSVLGEFGGLGLPLKGHLWKDSDNWGYRTFKTPEELRENYRRLIVRMHPLIGQGLAAAVYTQTTDVEIEVNGYLTYDREVNKFDVKEMAAWHKALFGPPPEMKILVPTSEKEGLEWKFTFKKPAAGWEKADFDAANWKTGPGGFGTRETPGSVVRTEWKTDNIWIRRSFNLEAIPTGEIFLNIHHDEDAEIFINGMLAAKVEGYTSDYTLVPLSKEAQKALKVGQNVIAVHCKQTRGGQYIDVGLTEMILKK